MPTPKLTEFEAKWLFWELGWVTLKVCDTFDGSDTVIIRGWAHSGATDGHFIWDTFASHKDARIALAQLEAADVFHQTCAKLNYTPHFKEKF